MAQTPEGIMALPNEPQAAKRPQLTLTDSYDVARTSLQNAQPEAAAQFQQVMDQLMPMLNKLSDTQLDQFLQLIQYLQDNEEQYPEIRKKLIAEGMDEEDLPPEYDPEYFAVIGTVILEAIRVRSAAVGTPPQQFARGGIAEAVRLLASKGRGQDTQLAHITPAEARMLRKKGGVGTINPDTGLPEFGIWGSIVGAVKGVWKAVSGAVKSILKNPIGRFISTVALSTFIGYPAASAVISLASGENLKTALISAGTAWLSGPSSPLSNVANRAASAFLPQAANAAVRQGVADTIVGTGVGLITGKSLSDSVKSGLTNAAFSYGAETASAAFPKNRINSPFASVNVNDPQIVDRSGLSPDAFALRSPKNYYDDADNIFDRSSMSPDAASLRANTSKPYGNANIEALSGRSPLAPTFSGMDRPNISPSPYSLTSQNFPDMGDAQGLRLNNAPAGLKIATPEISDIASNRIASTSANRAASPSGGIFDSLKSGEYMEAGEKIWDKISPSAIEERGMAGALDKVRQRFPGATDADIMKAPAGSPMAEIFKKSMPGMLSTYGPLAATGLGVMGLTGGFQQTNPQVDLDKFFGPRSADLMKSNPRKYYIQNIPGVTYTQEGAVVPQGYEEGGAVKPDPLDPKNFMVKTKVAAPKFTMDDIRVATPTLAQRKAEMANYTPVTSTMTATTKPGINNPAYQDISKMYQDVLGRAPDAEGLKYWMSTIGADRKVTPEEQAKWMGEAAKEKASAATTTAGTAESSSTATAQPTTGGGIANIPTGQQIGVTDAPGYRGRGTQYNASSPEYENLAAVLTAQPSLMHYMAPYNASSAERQDFYKANPMGQGGFHANAYKDTKGAGVPWYMQAHYFDNPDATQARTTAGVTATEPTYLTQRRQDLANSYDQRQLGPENNRGYHDQGQGFNATNLTQPWYMQEANYNLPDAIKARAVAGLAAGGIANMAPAYPMNTGGYPRRTGQIAGPGTEKSDSIPAMLSDGEFVMTSRAVRGMGKGSRRDGAKKMYALMHQLEKNASRG